MRHADNVNSVLVNEIKDQMLTFRETVILLAYIGTALANTRSFRKPAETFMKFGHIGIGLCFTADFSDVAPDSA